MSRSTPNTQNIWKISVSPNLVTEDEQQGIDNVALPGAIWSYDGREILKQLYNVAQTNNPMKARSLIRIKGNNAAYLMEGTNSLRTVVRLEISGHDLPNDKSGTTAIRLHAWLRPWWDHLQTQSGSTA